MSQQSKSPSRLSVSSTKAKNKLSARRAWIPLAASTAATLSLASCSMFGSTDEKPRLSASALPPATAPAPAALTDQIKQYAQNMNAAVDADEKKKLGKMTASSTGSSAVAPVHAESSKETASSNKPGNTGDSPIVLAAQTHEPETGTANAASEASGSGSHIGVNEPPASPAHPAEPAKGESEVAAKTHTPGSEAEAKGVEVSAPAASAGHDSVPRSTVAMAAMAATTPPAEATAVPSATPIAEAGLDPLLGALRQRAETHPQNLQYALALNLLESAETGKTPEPVAGANASDQKFLTELSSALVALTVHPAAPNASFAERAAPLLDLARSWQGQADLNLPKLALASRVDSFGVYTPVEPKFETGKRQVVIIYCEVANFTAKKTDDGMFQTKLAQQDTLITDDGLLIWRPNPEDVEDISRNQRHDFYLVKKLTIPDSLAIGKYTLRMSVTDKISNKVAMLSMPIEITPAAISSAK